MTGSPALAAHDINECAHAQVGVALRDLGVVLHELVQVVAHRLVARERRARAGRGVDFGREAPWDGDRHADVEVFELGAERLRVCWRRVSVCAEEMAGLRTMKSGFGCRVGC